MVHHSSNRRLVHQLPLPTSLALSPTPLVHPLSPRASVSERHRPREDSSAGVQEPLVNRNSSPPRPDSLALQRLQRRREGCLAEAVSELSRLQYPRSARQREPVCSVKRPNRRRRRSTLLNPPHPLEDYSARPLRNPMLSGKHLLLEDSLVRVYLQQLLAASPSVRRSSLSIYHSRPRRSLRFTHSLTFLLHRRS